MTREHRTGPGPRPRLLLVDDDASFCGVVKRALEKRGFDVAVAPDIAQGKSQCRARAPDYAVIDLRIGTESGLNLVRWLTEQDASIRAVVLTGYASIATAVEAIKLGAVHYLTKPAYADDIVAALNMDQGDPEVPAGERPLSVRRLEWEHLQRILSEHDGNISAAARALGMHRRTLQRKLQKRPVRE